MLDVPDELLSLAGQNKAIGAPTGPQKFRPARLIGLLAVLLTPRYRVCSSHFFATKLITVNYFLVRAVYGVSAIALKGWDLCRHHQLGKSISTHRCIYPH